MTYHFDLTAADYAVLSIRGFGWKPVLRYFFPHSLSAALITWILAKHGLLVSTQAASLCTVLVFLVAMGWFSSSWREKFVGTAQGYYAHPDRSHILGPHTLELSEAGLTSTGPLHKTFRDWRAIDQVAFTPSHVLFYTTFGVVYVLPMRAVSNLEDLEAFVKLKSPGKLAS